MEICEHERAFREAEACCYCLRPFSSAPGQFKTRDHVVPRAFRRINPEAWAASAQEGWGNIVPACERCNLMRAKLGHSTDRLLRIVRRQPKRKPVLSARDRLLGRVSAALARAETIGPDLHARIKACRRALVALSREVGHDAALEGPEAGALRALLEEAERAIQDRREERRRERWEWVLRVRAEAAQRRAEAEARRLDRAPEALAFPCPEMPPSFQMSAAPR